MSPKNNAAAAANNNVSPAQQGLDDLIAMDAAAEENTPAVTNTRPLTSADFDTTAANADDEELEGMSTGRVARYYTHKIKPGKVAKDNQQVIREGTTLLGRYEGSSVNEKSKFKSRTHKLALIGAQEGLNDGDIVGLASCGFFDKRFQFVPEGTKLRVIYKGSNEIKTGKWAGSDSYLYDVDISKSVNQKIKLKQTNSNYELRKLTD